MAQTDIRRPGAANSQAGATPFDRPVRYEAHVDIDGFRELYLARQGRYLRKVGAAIFFLFGIAAAVSVALLLEEPSATWLASSAALIVVTAFGLVEAVRPFGLVPAGVAREWFAEHGASVAQDSPIADLAARYEVTLEPEGFVEYAGGMRRAVPWAALSGRCKRTARGAYFPVDGGRDDSLAYNMAGVNWTMREGDVAGTLFVPASVLAEHPGIDGAIAAAVSASRKAARSWARVGA